MLYILLSSMAAAQATITVCPEPGCCPEPDEPDSGYVAPLPTCFEDLQAAIDAASDGDTIELEWGYYHTRVQINDRSLTLQGDPSDVILPTFKDPSGRDDPLFQILGASDVIIRDVWFDLANNQAIQIKGGDLALQNIQFDSSYSGVDAEARGVGAILRAQDATVVIENSILGGGGDSFPLSGSTAQIQLSRTDLQIIDSLLEEGETAAIIVPQEVGFDSTITITGTDIRGFNTWGGGVINGSGTLAIQSNTTLSDNSPSNSSDPETQQGAIVWRGNLMIEDALLRDNSAPHGSAITWKGGGTFTMIRTLLCKNSGDSLSAEDPSASVDITALGIGAGDRVWIQNNRFVDNDIAIRLPRSRPTAASPRSKSLTITFLGIERAEVRFCTATRAAASPCSLLTMWWHSTRRSSPRVDSPWSPVRARSATCGGPTARMTLTSWPSIPRLSSKIPSSQSSAGRTAP